VVVQGMIDFFTDLYERPMRISTLLMDAGFKKSDVELFLEKNRMDDLLLRFCPELWEWLTTNVGWKARTALVDYYSLFGDDRCEVSYIANQLEIDPGHASSLMGWALNKIRQPEYLRELEQILVSTARKLLPGNRVGE
jgi:hypothetical protein